MASKKEADEFGLRKAVKKLNTEIRQEKLQCNGFRKEANKKFAGKWVYNEIAGEMCFVKEVVGCRYPYHGRKYQPEMKAKNVLYCVSITAMMNLLWGTGVIYDNPITIERRIMDGKWKIAPKKQVSSVASSIMERIVKQIEELASTRQVLSSVVDGLKKISKPAKK